MEASLKKLKKFKKKEIKKGKIIEQKIKKEKERVGIRCEGNPMMNE